MRRLPDYRMWDAKQLAWFAKPTRRNLQHLRSSFKLDQMIWSPEASALYDLHVVEAEKKTAVFAAQKRTLSNDMVEQADDYKFGPLKPWLHQKKAFVLSRDRKAFALFMEMRTGRSR